LNTARNGFIPSIEKVASRAPAPRMRVLHVITGLQTGGAEMMLYRLISRLRGANLEHVVISLTGDGPLGDRLRELGVSVIPFDCRRALRLPATFLRIAACVRKFAPHIVHTWLYHADLMGGVAGKICSSAKIVWHIHHSGLVPPLIKPGTLRIAGICARLSCRIPARIVCSSEASLSSHSKFGYDSDRMLVIPNGFDLDEFRANPAARAQVRDALGIPDEATAIGLIGRFSPLKDQQGFLTACRAILKSEPRVHIVLCGEGITESNETLMQWAAESGVLGNCHFLGKRDDVPRVMAALDISVSSSGTESFPMVVGEAMAVGVPCVVTDVGDSARIVGGAGLVVPPANPPALAAGCLELIRIGAAARRDLGRQARERIRKYFSIESTAQRFEELYVQLSS